MQSEYKFNYYNASEDVHKREKKEHADDKERLKLIC